jgi:hypothetical protein
MLPLQAVYCENKTGNKTTVKELNKSTKVRLE